MPESSQGLCRDCLSPHAGTGRRCRHCRSPRVIRHVERDSLSIAHVDCDCFYAAVEKRDNPDLADKPVLIGGEQRGVVATACYVARTYGVKSAMPMFQAKRLCPDAVILKPRMREYAATSRQIMARLEALSPAVEKLSIDEAFIDLSGTAKLHGASPARLLAALVQEVERDIGVTLSVGLSHNKFLAKIASDQDKPRGFFLIGRAETEDFLKDQPVGLIWGVGTQMQAKLARDGITRIRDLRRFSVEELSARYGKSGARLFDLAFGRDSRKVGTRTATVKSISNETTFATDIGDLPTLERRLWRLCEKVSARAKERGEVGATVTLKLKRPDFRSLTRQARPASPSNKAHVLFDIGRALLTKEISQGPFRLIGIGLSHLDQARTPASSSFLEAETAQNDATEQTIDSIREKFGSGAIRKGRDF